MRKLGLHSISELVLYACATASSRLQPERSRQGLRPARCGCDDRIVSSSPRSEASNALFSKELRFPTLHRVGLSAMIDNTYAAATPELRLSSPALLCNLAVRATDARPEPTEQTIVVDGSAAAHPLPHFWEQMFGSGRAILTLRDGYRRDLKEVKNVTDFKYVRFHAIFHDEVGVYDEDTQGNSIYNFSYVDQIYDGLLAVGVRPLSNSASCPKNLPLAMPCTPFGISRTFRRQGLREVGRADYKFTEHLRARYGIEKSRNGISKYGTSRTSISGWEIPSSRRIGISMITPHAPSRR